MSNPIQLGEVPCQKQEGIAQHSNFCSIVEKKPIRRTSDRDFNGSDIESGDAERCQIVHLNDTEELKVKSSQRRLKSESEPLKLPVEVQVDSDTLWKNPPTTESLNELNSGVKNLTAKTEIKESGGHSRHKKVICVLRQSQSHSS